MHSRTNRHHMHTYIHAHTCTLHIRMHNPISGIKINIHPPPPKGLEIPAVEYSLANTRVQHQYPMQEANLDLFD